MGKSPIQCDSLKPKKVMVDEKYIAIEEFENDGTGYAKKINPFDLKFNVENQLFLEFINIDINNLLSIKNFVEKYGLLGIYTDKELSSSIELRDLMSNFTEKQAKEISNNDGVLNQENYNNQLISMFPTIQEISLRRLAAYSSDFKLESTLSFISEVKIMRCLSNIYKLNDVNKFKKYSDEFKKYNKELGKYIDELKLLLKNKGDDFNIIDEVISKYDIQDNLNLKIVGYFVSEKMLNTEFSFEVEGAEDAKPEVRIKYFVPTLLSGLYTMFYFHMVNGGTINKCPVCGNWYDTNNIGCTLGCIKVESSRRYRENKKNNPIFMEYETIRKRVSANMRAKGDKKITKEEFEKWKKVATKIRDDSNSIEEFKEKITLIEYKKEV